MANSNDIDTEGIRIRRATLEDADFCGPICYEAFATINQQHNFPPDIPSAEIAAGFLREIFGHPGFYSVVAENASGQIVGSNCLDERSAIAGIGPITIAPGAQNRSLGRWLMQAVIERSQERSFPGVRLLQSAFHNRSLSLYTKLGFDAREPISLMQGPPINRVPDGVTVRPAVPNDLDMAMRVCQVVHGHTRSGEMRDAIGLKTAFVVERHGRICGYTSHLGFFGHAVGETNLDVQALIGAAVEFAGSGILVPTRNSTLFRWCLENGLRVVYPMTLMTMGLYNEPNGAYLPSVLF